MDPGAAGRPVPGASIGARPGCGTASAGGASRGRGVRCSGR